MPDLDARGTPTKGALAEKALKTLDWIIESPDVPVHNKLGACKLVADWKGAPNASHPLVDRIRASWQPDDVHEFLRQVREGEGETS